MNATLARLKRLTAAPPAAGDGPLLDAFLVGDQAAFAALVRRHAGLVFATCRRILQHQQDAEDAFQATFLVLARRAADVWPRETVAPWLFGVARRVALKARTVRNRRSGRENPLEDVTTAGRLAPDFDLAETVHRVVLKLPAAYRAAVVACDLEGLSRKDAADRLGWSEGTLSGRLARARELLARRLGRTGVALPAGGLAAFAATSEGLSAKTVQSTVDLATGTGLAPAPVVALTEGVVRSMAIFKLKAMAAVMLTACALGFGAFAAGSGVAGDGADGRQNPTQGQGSAAAPAVPKAPKPLTLPPAKPVTDRDRLQGTWRVVALTEGGKTSPTNAKDPWVIEVSGNTLRMPYLEGGSNASSSSTLGGSSTGSASSGSSGTASSGTNGTAVEGGSSEPMTSSSTITTSDAVWKQRQYTFVVDEAKTPRTIDLLAKNTRVQGIYEFTAAKQTCLTCHKSLDEAKNVLVPQPLDLLGLCAPGLKMVDQRSLELPGRDKPGLKTADLGVRLAITIDGKRPTEFGGAGVIVFELQRQDSDEAQRARLLEKKKQLDAAIDAMAQAKAKAKIENERDAVVKELDDLVLLHMQRTAQFELRKAQAALEAARAQAVVAQANAALATETMKKAQAQVAVAEKTVADLKKPKPQPGAPADAAFTVHVRTLTAAEKVIRVKATGKETVLEALVYAADEVPIKSDGVSVWVVRDKAVLPVDLPAITKGGDAKTNYALKVGDQLFVQAKAAK